MIDQDIKQHFSVTGTIRWCVAVVLCLLSSSLVSAADTTYIHSEFGFRLTSHGILIQDTITRFSTDYPQCHEYRFEEWSDDQSAYSEITIVDCSPLLGGKTAEERRTFEKEFLAKAYASHYPWPDTSQLFRGNPSVQGGGKYAGRSRGEKYKYVKFLYKDLIVTLLISAPKKKLNSTYSDFMNRFELI